MFNLFKRKPNLHIYLVTVIIKEEISQAPIGRTRCAIAHSRLIPHDQYIAVLKEEVEARVNAETQRTMGNEFPYVTVDIVRSQYMGRQHKHRKQIDKYLKSEGLPPLSEMLS